MFASVAFSISLEVEGDVEFYRLTLVHTIENARRFARQVSRLDQTWLQEPTSDFDTKSHSYRSEKTDQGFKSRKQFQQNMSTAGQNESRSEDSGQNRQPRSNQSKPSQNKKT